MKRFQDPEMISSRNIFYLIVSFILLSSLFEQRDITSHKFQVVVNWLEKNCS